MALLGGLFVVFVFAFGYWIMAISSARKTAKSPEIQRRGKIIDKNLSRELGLVSVATYVIQCDENKERLTVRGEKEELTTFVVGDHIAFKSKGEILLSAELIDE